MTSSRRRRSRRASALYRSPHGRGKASDIRLSSHFISRLHAKIVTRGIATTIEDIGSKNGIFVNANRVKRCVLHDGDVVSLASELELKFVDAAH